MRQVGVRDDPLGVVERRDGGDRVAGPVDDAEPPPDRLAKSRVAAEVESREDLAGQAVGLGLGIDELDLRLVAERPSDQLGQESEEKPRLPRPGRPDDEGALERRVALHPDNLAGRKPAESEGSRPSEPTPDLFHDLRGGLQRSKFRQLGGDRMLVSALSLPVEERADDIEEVHGVPPKGPKVLPGKTGLAAFGSTTFFPAAFRST
ncbi:MAG: hypothetical protein IPN83_11440 [Holophagales bacterium]|nr:hypothetical protein [Holophagales bacterium]